MARLRNVQTGAVVSCSDATAARLGGGWEPVKQPVQKREAHPAKRVRKTD